MGRVKADTVEWFPHSCTHGTTIPILEGRFGNDGVALWWRLLEALGSAPGHYLDFRSEERWQLFAVRCLMPVDKVVEVMDFLAKLEAIDPKLWHGTRVVWSQNFVNGLLACYANRRRPAPSKPLSSKFKRQHNNTHKTGIESSIKYKGNNISTSRLPVDNNEKEVTTPGKEEIITTVDIPQSRVERSRVERSRVELKDQEHMSSAPAADPLDLSGLWIELTANVLPTVKGISPARQRKIIARLKDTPAGQSPSAYWRSVIERIVSSKFCCGGSNSGWRASFDWLLQPDVHLKVMEGKYDDNNGSKLNTTQLAILETRQRREAHGQ